MTPSRPTLTALRQHTRAKRYALLESYLANLDRPATDRPLRIVDLGGTAAFWRSRVRGADGIEITLVNNHHIDRTNADYDESVPWISEWRRDATELTADELATFDVVHSNSFVEHLESRHEQALLAATIEASGRPYFIQVPNKNCPVDPHFPAPVPFAARWPKPLLARLLTRSALGSGSKEPDVASALERLRYYTPIGYGDLGRLFPGADLTREWTWGVNPSLIASRPHRAATVTATATAMATATTTLAADQPTPLRSVADPRVTTLCRLVEANHPGAVVDRILVVGCGRGQEAAALADHFDAATTGIDLHADFDQEAARRADLRVMDATALDLADNSYDLVYSFHALEHIEAPDVALSEMRRVLAPGGLFCIGTPNRHRAIGYVGSRTSTLNKVRWNLQDIGMRLRGRFRNELGAHAGFSSGELGADLTGTFGQATEITAEYYRNLYRSGRVARLVRLAAGGPGRHLLPCIYFVGRLATSTPEGHDAATSDGGLGPYLDRAGVEIDLTRELADAAVDERPVDR